ncbi:YciI family protein [Nocardia sp. NPDC058666]|uniref:YciI family protein n=1 Tax=unclassified Nocardia TaxID=2637762 RepID=UPI003654E831
MPIFAVHYTYSEATAADRATNRPEHRGWLTGLVDAGTVLSTGPYPDGSGALLLFRAQDASSLTELLREDPFAKLGLVDAVRVVEWLPVMGAFAE